MLFRSILRRIARAVITVFIVEIIFVIINLIFTDKDEMSFSDLADPQKAIYSSILFFTDNMGMNFNLSYIIVLLITALLLVLAIYLSTVIIKSKN